MTRQIPRQLEAYRDLLNKTELNQLLESMNQPLPSGLRVNPLKADAASPKAWQQAYGWQLEQVPFCPTGWQLGNEANNLSRTVEHQMGHYYIQDAASMLPVELFEFKPEAEPSVLDMTAAPGGKTTHLISQLGDRGLVVANDSNLQRIAGLKGNLQRWGSTSAVITNQPGERMGRWLPEQFDYVLLDAPCSGEALRTSERHTSRLVSSHERNTLQQRQIKLLESALQATRPNGQVVYSTCSLAPEEDEAVLDVLLKRYPEQIEIRPIPQRVPIQAPGLLAAGAQAYDAEVAKALRLWPHLYNTAGFFAALIVKRDQIATPSLERPQQTLAKAGYKAVTNEEQQQIISSLQNYGFDLPALLASKGLSLWRNGKSIHAIPERWLSNFEHFPFVSAGIHVGKLSRHGFQPAHDLASRYTAQFSQQRLTISDHQIDEWLARRDLPIKKSSYADGSIVVVEDQQQRYLGLGQINASTLENLLPHWQ
ncbi:NOL1/NOP2/sun family putative RNA methylase [Herpetosiphon llansteffanensis]|uniref:NOL1/NOP2/sun family putative RNA methylase n=1 Tax=Herpetosiphon llansteffanensis TaxID=2094568 RepID=UPI000D7CC7CB|nr:NOL1/NOP2/sun family putative RNA methylase [Herpetosiphon llansteffanensis]